MEEPEKFKVPQLVFKPHEGGWQVLSEEAGMKITKALANPIRRAIFKLLDEGPIRQFELAKKVGKSFGRKYPQTFLRHHLNELASAGLIAFERDVGEKRAKIVYRAADVRIHFRERPKPEIFRVEGVPRTPEEFETELEKVLKKKRGEKG